MIYIALAPPTIGWVQFAKWQHSRVEKEVAGLSLEYTNTLQIKERVEGVAGPNGFTICGAGFLQGHRGIPAAEIDAEPVQF